MFEALIVSKPAAVTLRKYTPADTGVITKFHVKSVSAVCTIFVPVFVALRLHVAHLRLHSVICPTKRPDYTWPEVDNATPRRRTRTSTFWIHVTVMRAFIFVPGSCICTSRFRLVNVYEIQTLSMPKVVPRVKSVKLFFMVSGSITIEHQFRLLRSLNFSWNDALHAYEFKSR
jgi:hypothetical protein